jgi:ribonuclease HII
VVGGDARVASIAAASVLAKVARDHVMRGLHVDYPHYGFDQHKGYATALHLSALRTHGASPEHRRSFAPVREALSLTLFP